MRLAFRLAALAGLGWLAAAALSLPLHVLGPRGPARSEASVTATASAWREARLRDVEAVHEARIAEYAQRYGIGRRLSTQIYEAARAEQVSPALAFGLVRVESGFDPRARSPQGSIGLTQLQPRTARELDPRVGAAELYAPRTNLALGFRYLRRMLERFGHDVPLALAAYNRGPGHVEQQLARGVRPRTGFARKVLGQVEAPSALPL